MDKIVSLITDKIIETGLILIGFVLLLGLLKIFGKKALNWISWQIKKKKYLNSPLWKADNMTGEEFEMFLKAHLEKSGYRAKLTQKSHDYGADLIMTNTEGITLILQAKRSKKDIGISAIQEALGAVSFYQAHKGIVATNRFFTKSARDLAERSGVVLWNRHDIERIMKKSSPATPPEADKVKEQPVVNEVERCPLCQGSLKERSGKYGKFYGCSNYPTCKYTRKFQ